MTPTLWTRVSSFLKSLFLISCLLFHNILKYFRQFSPPSHNTLLLLSNTPTFLTLNCWVSTNIKGVILPVQLSLPIKNQFLIFLDSYTNISCNLNLWDIFSLFQSCPRGKPFLKQMLIHSLYKVSIGFGGAVFS